MSQMVKKLGTCKVSLLSGGGGGRPPDMKNKGAQPPKYCLYSLFTLLAMSSAVVDFEVTGIDTDVIKT